VRGFLFVVRDEHYGNLVTYLWSVAFSSQPTNPAQAAIVIDPAGPRHPSRAQGNDDQMVVCRDESR
jgi:hypothetical protein